MVKLSDAIQTPLDGVDGDVTQYDEDANKWGAVELSPPEGELTNQERLERLMAAGVIDPVLLLKLRLDVVTDFVVDPRMAALLEQSYNAALTQFIENGEEQLVRAELTKGVTH